MLCSFLHLEWFETCVKCSSNERVWRRWMIDWIDCCTDLRKECVIESGIIIIAKMW